MHALIYTIFVKTALDLSENSVFGIFIAFIFMNFMLKVDPIIRKIFGFSSGKGGSGIDKLTIDKIAPTALQIKAVANSRLVKGTVKSQGKIIGKVIGRPAMAAATQISNGIDYIEEEIVKKYGTNIQRTPEQEAEMKKKKKEKEQRRKEVQKGIKEGAGVGKELIKIVGKGIAAIPLLVAEPQTGIKVLDSTFSSTEKTADLIRKAKIKGAFKNPLYFGSYRMKGIASRNSASHQKLVSRFKALGINYHLTTLGSGINPAGGGAPYDPTDIGMLYMPGSDVYEKITQEEFNKRFRELSQSKLEQVLEKLDIGNLKYSSAKTTLKEIAEADDIDTTEMYAEVLALAQEKEEELEEKFKELSGTTAEKIEQMKKISPEFAKKMEEKKKEQLLKEARILAKPLSEIDIYKAIQNYKTKVPSFDPSSERITPRDIEGIAKEINEILEKKGEDVTMSNTFIAKVEKELANNQRRTVEKREKARNNDSIGNNIASKGKGKSLKEQIKELSAIDRANPNSSANAPQQNGGMTAGNSEGGKGTYGTDINVHPSQNGKQAQSSGNASQVTSGSSVERLVKNIKNASKGSSSKKSTTITPKAIAFAKSLEELDKLNVQASEITGEELYNIDEVLRRLANL